MFNFVVALALLKLFSGQGQHSLMSTLEHPIVVAADEQEAHTFHNALRFFRIVSLLPGDLQNKLLSELAKSNGPIVLNFQQLRGIWAAIPENVYTPRSIRFVSAQRDVQLGVLELPDGMFSHLQDALIPLYRRESLQLHAQFRKNLLGWDSQYDYHLRQRMDAHTDTIITYIEPISDVELQQVDLATLPCSDLFSYNVPGSREYFDKLQWADRYTENFLFGDKIELLCEWMRAIRHKDTVAQTKLLDTWRTEAQTGRWFDRHIERMPLEFVHVICNKLVDFDWQQPLYVGDDHIEYYADRNRYTISKLAKHIQTLHITRQSLRTHSTLGYYTWLSMYRWPALKTVTFDVVGFMRNLTPEIQHSLDTFCRSNPRVTVKAIQHFKKDTGFVEYIGFGSHMDEQPVYERWVEELLLAQGHA